MDVEKIVNSVDNFDEIAAAIDNFDAHDDKFETSASLVKIFGKLGKRNALETDGQPAKAKKIAKWLNEQIDRFFATILQNSEIELENKVSILLKLVLIKGKYAHLPVTEYIKALTQECCSSADFASYVLPVVADHDDLRYFISLEAVNCASPENLIGLLASSERRIDKDSDLVFYTSKNLMPVSKSALAYRQAFQKAWLHVLTTKLSDSAQKFVLSVLHARVIINMNKPQLLMDFLTDVYSRGGPLALLSLNAVFSLIQYYNLDYPNFFTQLYALLEDGSLLFSAHRARFLRLLDLFLTSTHLPATIPASILKRLARLCLFAPPSAIVAIVPFVYNQLKRHPSCMVMIHKDSDAPDYYDFYEPDPLKTRAIESSLWELESLSTHAHPNVAAIAKIMSQPFKKPEYHLEHFLAHSYETMYNTENLRRRDKEPGLEYDFFNALEESLFSI